MTNIAIRQSSARLLRRLRIAVDSVGILKSIWLVPLWLIVQRYVVFSGPVEAGDRAPGDPDPLFRTTELGADGIRAIVDADPTLTEIGVRRRLASGERCCLWWSEGAVAHYHWFTTTRARLPFVPLDFRPATGDYVVLGAFTNPAFRQQGLHAASVAWSARTAADLGLQRRITFVAWWNAPSLAAVTRGYEAVGTLTRWNMGFRSVFRTAGDVHVAEETVSLRSDDS